MLFSDITDCEMLVYRCLQEADAELSLVQLMEILENKYQRDWKRSTVCTFIAHLTSKGYVVGRREGRVIYYSSAINDSKFKEEQLRQFLDFWFHGSLAELVEVGCKVKKMEEKEAELLLSEVRRLEDSELK